MWQRNPSRKSTRRSRALCAPDPVNAEAEKNVPMPPGMADNSPTFQRWELDRQWVQVPKGRLKLCARSAVPSGLVVRVPPSPTLKRWAIVASPSGTKTCPRYAVDQILLGIGQECPRSRKISDGHPRNPKN